MNQNQKEKLDGNVSVRNRFLSWIENIWYHYKWGIIIVSFFVVTFAICFVQCTRREVGDLTVNYSGDYVLGAEERQAIRDVLQAVAPKDAESGEQLSVLANDYVIYSEEQLRELYVDESGELAITAYNTAKNFNTNQIQTLSTYIMTGECSLWFVSPYVYELQQLSKLAAPLNSVLDTVPENAYDAYAICLGDTAFYQYYDAIKVLPADTLIVLTKPFLYGSSSVGENYAYIEELYRTIVTFVAP